MRKRKVAIILGSTSDFKQCISAFLWAETAAADRLVEFVSVEENTDVMVNSIHRHGKLCRTNVKKLIEMGVDVIICGAGMAAHLPGMVDSYLRYELRNDHVVVFGVGFENPKNDEHTQAADLSIRCVPGTHVVFDKKTHMGSHGMTHALVRAVTGKLPKITLPDPKAKPYGNFSFEAAIQMAK